MANAEQQPSSRATESDSLATGVSYAMLLTVFQRGVGFLRTGIFCGFLTEQELGQWSLIFSFIMFMAPMTLMGITGSFGRYVEHYSQHGWAKQFFRRTATVVLAFVLLVLVGVWIAQDWVAWCVFGSVEQRYLLFPACCTLCTSIIYCFFVETIIALRRARVGSIMELVTSWTFAVVAVFSLIFTDLGSAGVVIGYAVGNLAGTVVGACVLFRIWGPLKTSTKYFSHLSMWKKLAPFALGLWVVNILTNTFDLVDRYMIVHFTGYEAGTAQGLVGQYFSSMAIPLLMVGLSTTLARLVMPYLSEDWEKGRFQAVSDRVNMSVKMMGLALCCGAAAMLLFVPFLFEIAFESKYEAGLGVLPYATAFCIWRSISIMVYNYLYCVERTRLMCVSLVLSLTTNVVLNAFLLPILGLKGAAVATALGNLLNLLLVLAFSVRFDFKMSRGVFPIILFPVILPLGGLATTAASIVLLGASFSGNWIFSSEERKELKEAFRGYLVKFFPNCDELFGKKDQAAPI